MEGGTRLVIDGINLGRNFADIQSSVRANYAVCTPIESLYEVSTRIVCETGPAYANKVSKASVVVQIRDDKKYLAISSDSFEYVVRKFAQIFIRKNETLSKFIRNGKNCDFYLGPGYRRIFAENRPAIGRNCGYDRRRQFERRFKYLRNDRRNFMFDY